MGVAAAAWLIGLAGAVAPEEVKRLRGARRVTPSRSRC